MIIVLVLIEIFSPQIELYFKRYINVFNRKIGLNEANFLKKATKKHKIKINTIKLIKKDSTPNSAIHPQLAEVVVFLHFKDKKNSVNRQHQPSVKLNVSLPVPLAVISNWSALGDRLLKSEVPSSELMYCGR